MSTYFWLLPSVATYEAGSSLCFIAANGEVLEFEGLASLRSSFSEIWSGDMPVEHGSSPIFEQILVPQLESRGWLASLSCPLGELIASHPGLSREITYFGHLYPHNLDTHFRALSRKRVLIIGCGGVGSNLAFAFCSNAVGHVTVVDPDVVEQSNLNRQFLYSNDDIGRPKVDVLAKELGNRFTATKIEPVHGDFDKGCIAKQLIDETDLIVVCGESKILYDDPSLCTNTPIMTCGYRGPTAIAGPLTSRHHGTACWECIISTHSRASITALAEAKHPSGRDWNPSGHAVNSIAGALCSSICISFLSGQSDTSKHLGVQYEFAMKSLHTRSTKVTPRSCAHTIQDTEDASPRKNPLDS